MTNTPTNRRTSRKAPHEPRELQIAYEKATSLKPDPKNARVHGADQLIRLKRSLTTFGFITPIVADVAGKIICGHARWVAATELGLPTVPVIRVEHLSAVQLRAFAIADNRLTDLSEWNDQALALQLKELSELDLDFSVEATGFSLPEIDVRIEALGTSAETDAADEIPEALPHPVSRLGDLWYLGDHRVLCGNAIDLSAYERLCGTDKANMVFTDPPYNVPIDGHVSGKGKARHREFAMAAGEMTPAEFRSFLTATAGALATHSAPGSLHYICMDWRHLDEILAAIRTAFASLVNLCVWVKTNGGMGSLYRSQHELVLVAKNGRSPHLNNVQLGRFGRNRTNVWTYASVNQFGRDGDEGNLAALHPTVKPVALVADAILDATKRGDMVLDPFLGSGSTLIAAERTGRRCFGIEIDPVYVDTIIRRWERFTGKRALHSSRRPFASLEKERGANG